MVFDKMNLVEILKYIALLMILKIQEKTFNFRFNMLTPIFPETIKNSGSTEYKHITDKSFHSGILEPKSFSFALQIRVIYHYDSFTNSKVFKGLKLKALVNSKMPGICFS